MFPKRDPEKQIPNCRVFVSRIFTVSVGIVVDAPDSNSAVEAALRRASTEADLAWVLDYDFAEPYVLLNETSEEEIP